MHIFDTLDLDQFTQLGDVGIESFNDIIRILFRKEKFKIHHSICVTENL